MSLADDIAEVIQKHFGGSSKEGSGNEENPVQIAKSVNTEKRHFTSVVLRPDVPDLHGDIYGSDVVEDACYDYNEHCRKANLQHLVQTELASPIESYIAKADFTLGDGEVKAGDWIMTMKVHDEELWEKCKDGTFTGFSVGCMAATEAIDD